MFGLNRDINRNDFGNFINNLKLVDISIKFKVRC